MLGVTIACRVEDSRLGQAVFGELTNGFEKAVTGASCDVVGDDQRLAHERIEVPQHVDVVDMFVGHDRADTREIKAAREDRCELQQFAFVVVEEFV